MAVFAPLDPVKEAHDQMPHRDLHGVADEGRVLQPVLVNEVCEVICHGRIVVASDVGGVPMVPEILALC